MRPGCCALALLVAAAGPWLAAVAAPTGEPTGELLRLLESAGPGDEIPVIVTYRSTRTPLSLRKSLAREPRAARRRDLPARLKHAAHVDGASVLDAVHAGGARRVRDLWIANSVALLATPDLLRSIAADPSVVQLRIDRQFYAPMPMTGADVPAEWNLTMLHAPEVWARGYRGQGVVVGLLDTGVDRLHPDLANAWRGGASAWFDPYGQRSAPYDTTGHGTQVLGLIVGGATGGSAVGVAPDARWIAARVFDDAGVAEESAVHLAFQWMLDPDGDPATDDAPDVVNNSWTASEEGLCNSAFQPDIDALLAADVAVVFAAGNFGPGPATSVSPSNNAGVQSVGAVDAEGRVAQFSSRGPSACNDAIYPKVVAPGDGVLTTDLSLGGQAIYAQVSGTSFSAPHVSGVLALLRGASPDSTAEQIESALVTTASDVSAAGPDNDAGFGVVNALAALEVLPLARDLDGDGYASGDDCDDTDPRVHPGAKEVRNDGTDQDCNGYDLTTKVHYAVYSHDGSALNVRATSRRGSKAALEIVGIGAMTWRPRYDDWVWRGTAGAQGPQRQILLRSVEGEVTARPRKPTPSR